MRGELRTDETGRWLCNAVLGCTALATVQAAEPCVSCQQVAQTAAAQADELRPQIEQLLVDVTALEQTVLTEERAPTNAEIAQHTAARLAVEQLAVQVRGHVQTSTLHTGPHTHPVMACKKHTSALPAPA